MAKTFRTFRWGCTLIIVISLGGLLLRAIGWCAGWWAQDSDFLQYLLQCKCPRFTESLRLPPTADIILSACDTHDVEISLSGRMLFVEDKPEYVWDMKTDEKIQVIWPEIRPFWYETSYMRFLTDDVLFNGGWLGPELFDYRTGEQFPLQEIEESDLQEFLNVDEVLLFPVRYYAVALSSNYHDDEGVILLQKSLGSRQIADYLQQNGVTFHHYRLFHVLDNDPWCKRLMSHDDKFSYRHCKIHMDDSGIYLEATNQKIVDAIPGYMPIGWIFDNSGVILEAEKVCIFKNMGNYCEVELPQPILKLNLPDGFLDEDPILHN